MPPWIGDPEQPAIVARRRLTLLARNEKFPANKQSLSEIIGADRIES